MAADPSEAQSRRASPWEGRRGGGGGTFLQHHRKREQGEGGREEAEPCTPSAPQPHQACPRGQESPRAPHGRCLPSLPRQRVTVEPQLLLCPKTQAPQLGGAGQGSARGQPLTRAPEGHGRGDRATVLPGSPPGWGEPIPRAATSLCSPRHHLSTSGRERQGLPVRRGVPVLPSSGAGSYLPGQEPPARRDFRAQVFSSLFTSPGFRVTPSSHCASGL